jgi:hypothetical protein
MNGHLGTKSFAEKKQLLIDHEYTLPKFIINKEEWAHSDALTHSDEMAKTAYNEIWKI